MNRIALTVALAAIATLAACKKTGEGEYEVQRPTIGTTTDTINTPSVNVGTDTARIVTPDVDVRRDTSTVRVPKVTVKP